MISYSGRLWNNESLPAVLSWQTLLPAPCLSSDLLYGAWVLCLWQRSSETVHCCVRILWFWLDIVWNHCLPHPLLPFGRFFSHLLFKAELSACSLCCYHISLFAGAAELFFGQPRTVEGSPTDADPLSKRSRPASHWPDLSCQRHFRLFHLFVKILVLMRGELTPTFHTMACSWFNLKKELSPSGKRRCSI